MDSITDFKKFDDDKFKNLKRRFTKTITLLQFEQSCIVDEIENARKDKRIKAVNNVLEKNPFPKNTPNIINPCFGDPCFRDICEGGFLLDESFVKPDEFYHFDNYAYLF